MLSDECRQALRKAASQHKCDPHMLAEYLADCGRVYAESLAFRNKNADDYNSIVYIAGQPHFVERVTDLGRARFVADDKPMKTITVGGQQRPVYTKAECLRMSCPWPPEYPDADWWIEQRA